MTLTFRAASLALLCAFLASCNLIRPKQRESAEGEGMPATAAVVPVNNQSQDITMPVLIRYFLEEALDDKGFKVPIRFDELDNRLRQLGITEGAQVNDGNIQNIGQNLKVDGIVQGTLYEVSMNKGVKVLRASFRLVSVFSGRTLWEKQVEIEQKVGDRLPVKGTVTSDWTLKRARSMTRSGAGKLPKKLVRDALKTLKN
ncbi:MAG: hypothetical protein A3A86_07855 [Elusimicrobia bacterium RIFCSPLOWO2_01_FULL_60_11]|nr:MAG: hypothetical protein A3A86_07855 [Elusimicrobia bacterium RIFCSPLOWO2_01_FULL_60_11]